MKLTIQLDPWLPGDGPTDDAADDGQVHIAGTVRREDGAEHPFVGWIGLMALLHDAVVLSRAS